MNSDHSGGRAATPSARILERVREDATDLALLATVTTHDWKLLSDKNGTQMYEMSGESLSSQVSTVRTFGKGGGGHPSEFYLVRAATTVRTDVNAMLDVLRTSTSEDFRAVMKKIFDKQFESGAVVDSLSCTCWNSNADTATVTMLPCDYVETRQFSRSVMSIVRPRYAGLLLGKRLKPA
ncbi:hypothetical protein PR003_g20651 [Phytophthora rubi]|uniref:START domain-containing protein n=1 Tax=Phytophthora rubi TaxID=129364 RepID=A0A6A4DL64_9STRA|nr:hypothetical protein PR003_g20651 [Phytophthora rubi]